MSPAQFVYYIFGLYVRCNASIPEISSIQIPDLVSGEGRRSPNAEQSVHVYLNERPDSLKSTEHESEELSYTSDYKDSAGQPALRLWKVDKGQFLRLEYFDGTQFWLDRGGTHIWATWPENLTIEDAATYLLGPVLGLVLRLRGVTCLHASAVSFGDCAVAFVGAEGAGKSTTAAAFAQQGHGIVSDDVVALSEVDGIFHVHPAYPYLCLWPESVESIYGSVDALPRLSRNYEKRCLSLDMQRLRFESRTLPLKAVYVLGERRSERAPQIERLPAQKSMLALVANTFATNVLDGAQRAKEFETLAQLIPRIKVREAFAHTEAGRLSEFCGLIRADVEAMDAAIIGAAKGSIGREALGDHS